MSDGYFFVPLPERARRTERPQAVHDRRVEGALSGTIEVVLRAEQPVHVGSGFKALCDDGAVVRRGAEVRGRPGVPGSSLKGVIRSRYEAITLSCAGQAPNSPKRGSVKSRSREDVKNTSFTSSIRNADVFRNCDDRFFCSACALFGRMSRRSRVTVTDFATEDGLSFSIKEMPEQFSPKAHHLGTFTIEETRPGEKEFRVNTLKGRKFGAGEGPVADGACWQRVEAIPAGALLRGQLRISNVLPEELGGLLVALGRCPKSALKIGAGKGHGFGRVAVHGLSFRLQDHARAVIAADETEETVWKSAFEGCLDRWASGEEALVRIHGGNC